MDKRYQVFISSTYSDLKEERSKVMQTIMSLDCIPAGMELFPAMDIEQFNFIKRIIDDCDYYILIIGGRYGSMDVDGISYTEKEYDYAVSKGIPVLAFLHDDINNLPVAKSDIDADKRSKLEAFREKVATGRLVCFWSNPDELNGQVAVSLTMTIKTYPAIGWVRANLQTNAESLQEMNNLRKELAEFKQQRSGDLHIENIADLDEETTIHGIYYYETNKQGMPSLFLQSVINPITPGQHLNFVCEKNITWEDLFTKISPSFMIDVPDNEAERIITDAVFGGNNDKIYIIRKKDFQKIKIQLLALGLINLTKNNSVWRLSDKGSQLMLKLNAIKSRKK